jgi:hypothetical protein
VAIYFDHVTAYTISCVIGADYIRIELFVVDYTTTNDLRIFTGNTSNVNTVGYLVELEVVKVTKIVLERGTKLQ